MEMQCELRERLIRGKPVLHVKDYVVKHSGKCKWRVNIAPGAGVVGNGRQNSVGDGVAVVRGRPTPQLVQEQQGGARRVPQHRGRL